MAAYKMVRGKGQKTLVDRMVAVGKVMLKGQMEGLGVLLGSLYKYKAWK